MQFQPFEHLSKLIASCKPKHAFGSILFQKKTTVLFLSLLETLHAMRIICTIRYCSQYLLPLTNSRTITISGTYVTTTKYILYMNNEAKSLNLGCFEPNTE